MKKIALIASGIILLFGASDALTQTVNPAQVAKLTEGVVLIEGRAYPIHRIMAGEYPGIVMPEGPGGGGEIGGGEPTPEPEPTPAENPFAGPVPWDRPWTSEETAWLIADFHDLSGADLTTFYNNWRYLTPEADRADVISTLIPEMATYLNAATWPFSAPFNSSGMAPNGWHVSSYTGLYDDLIGGSNPAYSMGAYNEVMLASTSFWGRMPSSIEYVDFQEILTRPLTQSQQWMLLDTLDAGDWAGYFPNLTSSQRSTLRTALQNLTPAFNL